MHRARDAARHHAGGRRVAVDGARDAIGSVERRQARGGAGRRPPVHRQPDLSARSDRPGHVHGRRDRLDRAARRPIAANAKAQLDARDRRRHLLRDQPLRPAGGSNLAGGARHARSTSWRARATAPDATKVIVYIGDGGSRHRPARRDRAPRTLGRARGRDRASAPSVDGAVIRQIASSPNDYFYSPSAAGVDFAFNNLNQDLCRNRAPFVSAGGDQGAVQRPHPEHADAAGRGPRRRRRRRPAPDQRVDGGQRSGAGRVRRRRRSPVTDALFPSPARTSCSSRRPTAT